MTTTKTHPVSYNHPSYKLAFPKWKRVRDAAAGSDAIKAAGEEYLPKLASHKSSLGSLAFKGTPTDSKYEAYKKRAMWFNATRRTIIGLSGAATLEEPKKELGGPAAEQFGKDVLAKKNQFVEESFQSGRYAIVVNQVDNKDPFFTFWCAESIVNWRFEAINGKKTLMLLVLEATEEEFEDNNPYEPKTKTIRHSYRLIGEEGARQCVYQKFVKDEKSEAGWLEGEVTTLAAIGGRTLDFIPASVWSPLRDEEEGDIVDDPITLDLVDVNISHYQNSADLEHGRHWCAMPTAVAIGFPTIDHDGQPIEFAIGGEQAWATDQTGANAFYLEFSGAGLGHLSEGMKEKKAEMAVLGARLLEEAKPAVEAANTIRTRLIGEKSILSRVAQNVSKAMTWTVRLLMWFRQPGYDRLTATDRVDLNTDFLDKSMTTEQLTALVSALQANAISYDTFFQMCKNAGIIPPERTLEEEEELIDAGKPGQSSMDPFADPNAEQDPNAPPEDEEDPGAEKKDGPPSGRPPFGKRPSFGRRPPFGKRPPFFKR